MISSGVVTAVLGNSIRLNTAGGVSVMCTVPAGNNVPQLGQTVLFDDGELVAITGKRGARRAIAVGRIDGAGRGRGMGVGEVFVPMITMAPRLYNGDYSAEFHISIPYVDYTIRRVDISRASVITAVGEQQSVLPDVPCRWLFRRNSDGVNVCVTRDSDIIEVDGDVGNPAGRHIDSNESRASHVYIASYDSRCTSVDEGVVYGPVGCTEVPLTFSSSEIAGDGGYDTQHDYVVCSFDVNAETAHVVSAESEFTSSRLCTPPFGTRRRYSLPTLQYGFMTSPPVGSVVESGSFSREIASPQVVNIDAVVSKDECQEGQDDCPIVTTRAYTVHNYNSFDIGGDLSDGSSFSMKYKILCCGMSYSPSNDMRLLHDDNVGYVHLGTIGGRYDVWFAPGYGGYVFAGNGKIVAVTIGDSIRGKIGTDFSYRHLQSAVSKESTIYWVQAAEGPLPVVFDADAIDAYADGEVHDVDDDAAIVFENKVASNRSVVDMSIAFKFSAETVANNSIVVPLTAYSSLGVSRTGLAVSEILNRVTGFPEGQFNIFVVDGWRGDIGGFVAVRMAVRGYMYTVYISNMLADISNDVRGGRAVGYRLYSSMLS